MRNRIAVEHKKHEDGLDRKGEVVLTKFQYHSLPQTILEMMQFKMPSGTYDPL